MSKSSLVSVATRLVACALLLAVLNVSPLSFSPRTTYAATSAGCENGGFRVTLPNGQVVSGNTSAKINASALPSHSRIAVRGRYVEFDVDVSTFATYTYALTGAANTQDLTGGTRTVLFASKVPDLAGRTLDSGQLEIKVSDQSLELLRKGSAGKMKIQAKDCATGGIFQMEPEMGANVNITHTLAPGSSTSKTRLLARSTLATARCFVGRIARKLLPASRKPTRSPCGVSRQAGRMGGVLGEDAVEASAGASPCVQDCQAQNRIRGSLPVNDPFFNS